MAEKTKCFLVVVDAVAVPVVVHNIIVAVAAVAAVFSEAAPRCAKAIAVVVHGIAEEPGQQKDTDIYIRTLR